MKTFFEVLLALLIITTLQAWSEPLAARPKKTKHSRAEKAQPEVIAKIEIKGNKKIEAEAIRSRLISRVGGPVDLGLVRRDVEEIFKLGYFYDVQVDQEGKGPDTTLTYTVVEKPSLVEIKYVGNSEVDDTQLAETTNLKPFEILNMAKIREAVEKIENMYEEKGYFLARVESKVEPAETGDGVKVTFQITENEKVLVKKITFLGNQHLTSEQLKSVMVTQEGGFFSFISGSGSYKQEAFDRDVQVLSLRYLNEGYVQVKIDRPQVFVTPDKRGIYISIRVEEGEQFRIGNVDFAGDILFTKDELLGAIETKEGKPFSYDTLQKDLAALGAKYGDLGYAFANIIPRPVNHEKERVVDLTFDVDKGYKVYIGKINMIGNSRTRDKVIRREMKIVEGELYNETRKRESMANIKRLGFFDEVNFNPRSPKNDPSKLDIDVVVKERNTGSLQIGAGYSSYAGFVLNGQITQSNWLGKGQSLSASVDYSTINSLFRLSFTEPYFNDTRWSLGFDAYASRRLLTDYSETKRGGAVRVGHPLAPYLFGYISYKLDTTQLDLTDTGDPDLFPVNTANGWTSSMTFSLEYDRRNDRFAPTKGYYSSASLEYAGLGGQLHYTKGLATARYYKDVFWDIIWRNNLSYGFVRSNVPDQDPPFNQLFLLGGANDLRGFEWFTVGRKKFSAKAYNQAINAGQDPTYISYRPFGGTQQIFYNMEFQFPLISDAKLFGVTFYDIGYADDSIELNDLRSDVGFGVRWYSPLGPLRLELGFPLHREAQYGEQGSNFQFAIGAPF